MQQEVQIEKGEGNSPGGQAGEPEGGRAHADRLQDTMDQRPDDDAEYLALEAKHAGQRLLKVMQVIAETEELELE